MNFDYFLTAFGGAIVSFIVYLIKSNSTSHKEIYKMMNSLENRLIRIETKIEDKVNGKK